MFSLDLMTAPTPLPMGILSPQPTVISRSLESWRGWESAWCAIQWALSALTCVPLGPVPAQKQASLFCDGRQKEEEEALLGTQCLIATAVITLFNVSTVDPQIT